MFSKFTIKELKTIGFGTVVLNIIVQNIFRVNSKCNFMIHYTSRINMAQNIEIEKHEESKTVYNSLASSNGLYINALNGVNLSKGVLLASGVKIISANHDYKNRKKHIKTKPINLEENVWIGTNAVILPGVKVGKNSIIGAGSVVTKNVPDNVIVIGNPAIILKDINV